MSIQQEFSNSTYPYVPLRFFGSTHPMNLIQLLLHSPGPKLVARRTFKNLTGAIENFLDAFKDAQPNGRQNSQN